MKLPWVSRRQYDMAMATSHGWWCHYTAAGKEALRLSGRVSDLERALDIANALRRDEQWRRIKAEGQVSYMQDRIRRVLGLPIWPEEEKKAG